MRNYLLAGAAALVIAAPAAATQDNSPYVGIEAGVVFPKSQSLDGRIDFTNPAVTDFTVTHVGNVRYKKGLDLDFIGGYDFGMFRLEGELGYKRAGLKSVSINDTFLNAINTPAGTTFVNNSFGINPHATVLSGMVNGLLDFGGNASGFGAYAGGGLGVANVKTLGSSSTKFAWQLIAGAYVPVTSNIDIGLKYRYFHAGRSSFNHDFAFTPVATTCGAVACTGGTAFFSSDSKFTSNSLLASVVYSFGAAAPPPPPPPPAPPPAPEAPATQTCPDGSVILATSTCPAPPPPPPPPPPPTERGERGR